MSPNTLRIFELCNELATLLSDKQAIADLQVLLDRHPEMFRDIAEVASTIDEVVKKPEIIVDANRNNEPYKIIKAAKKLDDKKMGDVIIKNEGGTNEIFHANKKKISEFTRLEKRLIIWGNLMSGGDTQSPRPDENRVRVAGTETEQVRSPISESNSTKESAQSQTTPKIRRRK